MLVTDDKVRAVALGEEGHGLGVLSGFAALDLDNVDWTKLQGATASRGSCGVIQSEFAFRRRAQPGDAEQRDLQRAPASTVWAEPTDQIFSML